MITYDEKICVKCLACVSESEFGGVTYERGRIFFDETCAEDWENIISICPVAAIKKSPKRPIKIYSFVIKIFPMRTPSISFTLNLKPFHS